MPQVTLQNSAFAENAFRRRKTTLQGAKVVFYQRPGRFAALAAG